MSPALRLKLYSAWFCPFAQRVWIGLKQKGIDFELIEVDPYNKSAEWLSVSPKGLVPVIVDEEGRSVFESGVILEYLEDRWPANNAILPTDAFERAQERLLCDHISKKIIPPFYRLLIKESSQERTDAKQEIIDGLRYLFGQMNVDKPGPFFGGNDLSMTDIMLAPFGIRFDTVLRHYRNFEIPSDLPRCQRWIDAICNHLSVTPTMADKQELLESYQRYADNSAQSQVAEAIRCGTTLP